MATKTDNQAEPTGAPALPSKSAKASAKPPTGTESSNAPTPDVQVKQAALDTPESDAAIDDIVAKEADEVLAAQDAGIAAAQTAVDEQAAKPAKHGHPIFWFIMVLLVVAIAITVYVLTNPGAELPFS